MNDTNLNEMLTMLNYIKRPKIQEKQALTGSGDKNALLGPGMHAVHPPSLCPGGRAAGKEKCIGKALRAFLSRPGVLAGRAAMKTSP